VIKGINSILTCESASDNLDGAKQLRNGRDGVGDRGVAMDGVGILRAILTVRIDVGSLYSREVV